MKGLPGGQVEQTAAPPVLYIPLEQALQLSDPELLEVPTER